MQPGGSGAPLPELTMAPLPELTMAPLPESLFQLKDEPEGCEG
jgi:hypothetical protein